jgi:DNA replication protein DnaC
METPSEPTPKNEASTASPSAAGRASSDLSDAEAEKVLQEASRVARERAAQAPKSLAAVLGSIGTPEAREQRDREHAERTRQRVIAENRRAVQAFLDVAGIPARYREASLNTFDHLPEDVRDTYRRKAEALTELAATPTIIGLCGNRGPGKTYMACALVRRFCGMRRSARYAVTMDYFTAIKSEYGKKDGDEAKIDRLFAKPDLLVLDEIQVRGETEWENRLLTRLIDNRYSELKTTILITNETHDEFLRNVGASVANRINDGGAIIECNWPSLRGRIVQPEAAS